MPHAMHRPLQVSFGQTLDLDTAAGMVTYKLRSVVTHHGDNMNSGHYTCCTRSEDGRWYFKNDHHP